MTAPARTADTASAMPTKPVIAAMSGRGNCAASVRNTMKNDVSIADIKEKPISLVPQKVFIFPLILFAISIAFLAVSIWYKNNHDNASTS